MSQNSPQMAPKKKKKKEGVFSKVLMGVIVGGAVGSVIGATMTDNTGRENRKILRQKSKVLIDKGTHMIEQKFQKKSEPKKRTVWHVLHDLFHKN